MVVKQRLAAKGKASSSTNSSDIDRIRSKQPVARPQPSSQPTTTLCVQEFKNNKRIAHKPLHGNTSRSVKDPKVPLRSKPPSTVAQATTDSSKCLPKAQKHQQRKLEQPAKHSKPLATGSSVQKAKPPPPAVKFDDLMKLAQRKSSDLQEKAFSMGKTSADGAVVQPQQSLQGTSGKLLSRGSSPVGKALLEKKGKERKAEPTLTKPTPGSVECKNSQTSASVSGTGDKDHSSIKTKSAGITVNRGQVRECFKMRPPSGAGRLNGTSLQSTKTATQASKKLNPGPMGRDSNPVRTNSFYGARHEKLSVPVGKAKFKTRHNPGVGMPTSSWAQEMSQFVKQRKARGEEEEEEEDEYEEESDEYDDMDDFLDDEEDSCDYSSVIRDIFRYDKRKYVICLLKLCMMGELSITHNCSVDLSMRGTMTWQWSPALLNSSLKK